VNFSYPLGPLITCALRLCFPLTDAYESGPMISGGHPQNQLTPAQMAAQQASAKRAEERAKLRSRQPTDKNIPDGVEDCITGDGVQRYRELRDVERRLDATMMRKRLDIQDAVNRNVKVSGPDLFRILN
jgi:SWI/SNF-related matrix-associated actin-dependent regulator of chromatin subfamily D